MEVDATQLAHWGRGSKAEIKAEDGDSILPDMLSTMQSTATKSVCNPRTTLEGNERKAFHQRFRLNVASRTGSPELSIADTELSSMDSSELNSLRLKVASRTSFHELSSTDTELNTTGTELSSTDTKLGSIDSFELNSLVDVFKKGESLSSINIRRSHNSAAVTKDHCSSFLAAQSPQCLNDQLKPKKPDPQRSGMHPSLDVDGSSTQGEELQFVEETSQAAARNPSHQSEVNRQPVSIVGSKPPTLVWILKSKNPCSGWALWQGADLFRESLDSLFAAVTEHTSLTGFHSLKIELGLTKQSFTFIAAEEDSDHFEVMKQFMSSMIEVSSREDDSNMALSNIWISPIVLK